MNLCGGQRTEAIDKHEVVEEIAWLVLRARVFAAYSLRLKFA